MKSFFIKMSTSYLSTTTTTAPTTSVIMASSSTSVATEKSTEMMRNSTSDYDLSTLKGNYNIISYILF